MNTNDPIHPGFHPANHNPMKRIRSIDRIIALHLCRAAYRLQNNGVFTDCLLCDDRELADLLRLPVSHIRHLRSEDSPLWKRRSNDILLTLCEDTNAVLRNKSSVKRLARRQQRRIREQMRDDRRAALAHVGKEN